MALVGWLCFSPPSFLVGVNEDSPVKTECRPLLVAVDDIMLVAADPLVDRYIVAVGYSLDSPYTEDRRLRAINSMAWACHDVRQTRFTELVLVLASGLGLLVVDAQKGRYSPWRTRASSNG